MSSESHARNMAVESPRFPGEGSSAQGKSGPKVRTEVVADGQQVEIPAPPRNEAVTQKDSASRVMVNPVARTRQRSSRRRPYRKPTQVGEERILRRTGEPLLRNSAK